MKLLGYVAPEKGVAYRHAAADYAGADFSRAKRVQILSCYNRTDLDLPETVGRNALPSFILGAKLFNTVYETADRECDSAVGLSSEEALFYWEKSLGLTEFRP